MPEELQPPKPVNYLLKLELLSIVQNRKGRLKDKLEASKQLITLLGIEQRKNEGYSRTRARDRKRTEKERLSPKPPKRMNPERDTSDNPLGI